MIILLAGTILCLLGTQRVQNRREEIQRKHQKNKENKEYRTEDIQKKEREEPQAYPDEEGSPKRNKAKNKTGGQPFSREQEGERAGKQGNEEARKQSSEKAKQQSSPDKENKYNPTPTHHDSTALPA